jgi:hypothetical protein
MIKFQFSIRANEFKSFSLQLYHFLSLISIGYKKRWSLQMFVGSIGNAVVIASSANVPCKIVWQRNGFGDVEDW